MHLTAVHESLVDALFGHGAMSDLSPLCDHERTWAFGSEHSRLIDRDTARGMMPTVRRMRAAVPAGVAEQGINTGDQGKGTAPPE
jgi:hypothetical protein